MAPRYDEENILSDSQSITASAKSTNSIDLKAPRFIGVGDRALYLLAKVTEAFTDAGSDSTVTVSIESSTTVGMGSPTSRQSIGIFAALSAIGAYFQIAISDKVAPDRWIQLDYTVTNGNLSTGKIFAVVTSTPQFWFSYPQGSTGPSFA